MAFAKPFMMSRWRVEDEGKGKERNGRRCSLDGLYHQLILIS